MNKRKLLQDQRYKSWVSFLRENFNGKFKFLFYCCVRFWDFREVFGGFFDFPGISRHSNWHSRRFWKPRQNQWKFRITLHWPHIPDIWSSHITHTAQHQHPNLAHKWINIPQAFHFNFNSLIDNILHKFINVKHIQILFIIS